MCISGFWKGLVLGAAVGMTAEWLLMPHPHGRHTAVGKAMQKMGNAVDATLEDISDFMH